MRCLQLVSFAALLLMAAGRLAAVERSSPDLTQERQADLRMSVLKPRYLFNMRGRRDPFVNTLGYQTAGNTPFSISALQFKGMMEVDGQKSALFTNFNDKAVYTLRGSQLFGTNDQIVAGVTGRVLNEKEVRLRQGELTLTYSALRAVKRKF